MARAADKATRLSSQLPGGNLQHHVYLGILKIGYKDRHLSENIKNISLRTRGPVINIAIFILLFYQMIFKLCVALNHNGHE